MQKFSSVALRASILDIYYLDMGILSVACEAFIVPCHE